MSSNTIHKYIIEIIIISQCSVDTKNLDNGFHAGNAAQVESNLI